MYTVSFYTSILPIVLAWNIVGMSLTYMLDKYKILRSRTIKFALGDELSKEMTEMLEIIMPIYTLAADIFLYLINGHFGDFYTMASLILGVFKYYNISLLKKYFVPY